MHIRNKFKVYGTMLVFLLDRLRFSKLLKLHQTEGRISSNLLKRKQENKHRVP